jgi:2-deoxy-D-gluconate 3-dehydrogenase
MTLFDLTGKKAIVTGASRGLGKGMATGLHLAGAEVVILDISDEAESTAKELGAEGPAVYAVRGDMEQKHDRQRAFEEAVTLLGGRLDILINNAGIHDRRSCAELPVEAWERVMEVNINAIYHLCKLAGEVMLKQQSGKIINMASMLSFIGGFNASAYAASKGAVAQLTKSLSNEWAMHGIQVNAIAPGYMDTSMNKDLHADAVRYPQVTARIPAGRWGTPEDLQGIAVFLSSAASSYITGAVIPVDGGYLVR